MNKPKNNADSFIKGRNYARMRFFAKYGTDRKDFTELSFPQISLKKNYGRPVRKASRIGKPRVNKVGHRTNKGK